MDKDKFMDHLKLLVLIFLIAFPNFCAASYYGATFSHAAVAKEPSHLLGNQFMLTYDPERFTWRRFNLYFDGGFTHYWVNHPPYYRVLNIYSIAPVVRHTFKNRGPLFPFIELSIGLAYLNHTRIDDRNLGIHFAFQDRIGIGILFGYLSQFSFGIHAVHYSNAHLSSHNCGVSVPLEVDLGFRILKT